MLGQNMKQYLTASVANQSDVKTIAMKDSTGISIMIMNRNKTKPYSYSVKLNNEYGAASSLQIKVDASIDKQITGILPEHATQMLSIDTEGNLLKLYTYTSQNANKMEGPSIELIESACNSAPTIDFIEKVNIPADSGSYSITLTGISDGNSCTQGVSIEVYSLDSSIAIPVNLTYTSCNSTGTLDIKPIKAGNTSIILKLTDGGEVGCNRGSVKYMGIDVNSYSITNIPALLECEDYYDMSGLILDKSTLGTQYLGYSDAGDYVEYKVNATYTGTHYMTVGVANGSSAAAKIIISENGTELNHLEIAKTGGWQLWKTQMVSFNLTEGIHTIRLAYETSGANIDFMIFTTDPGTNNIPYTAIISPINGEKINAKASIKISASGIDNDNDSEKVDFFVDNNLVGTSKSAPYEIDWLSIFPGNHILKTQITDAAGIMTESKHVLTTITEAPASIILPGIIEAEEYVAMEGIQTEDCLEGGINVGYINAGDWLEYSVNIPISGNYTLKGRVAGWVDNSSIELLDAEGSSLAQIVIPNSGGYQEWTDTEVSEEFKLNSGIQTIRMQAVTDKMNLNYFTFEKVDHIELSVLKLSPSNAQLGIGSYVKLMAVAMDANNNEIQVNPEWNVDNDGLINQYGVFLAETEGIFTITAKINNMEAFATITVVALQQTYDVAFKVTDIDNTPLSKAKIILQGFSKTTDTDGTTTFYNISPADKLVYKISKTNYFDTVGTLAVVDNNMEMDIALKKSDNSVILNSVKHIIIFPNPSTGKSITIQNANGCSLSIIDISGKIVLKQSLTNSIDRIGISMLETGIYLLNIKNENINYSQKLVIQ